MSFAEKERHFIILYNNGDIFFFTVSQNGELNCKEFNRVNRIKTGKELPLASSIELTNNNFKLKNKLGETIYSLKEYHQATGIIVDELVTIEKFYIDSDVRQEMLDKEIITFDETITEVPGLINEQELKGRARTRSPIRK